MLAELRIKNFVIIDDLSITFSNGLNILTGETGAGKSILIDALSGILGEKMTTDMIRTGFEKASLEASFDISAIPQLKLILNDSGIDSDDGTLILRRELFSSGKGRSFANSVQVSSVKLKEISEFLIDIHGQNEHQNIIRESTHRELLDNFGGNQSDVQTLRGLHAYLHDLKERLQSFKIDEREKARRIEFNTYAINEISSAHLSPGEEDSLKNEANMLANAEKLFRELNAAAQLVNGEGGILQQLKKTEHHLTRVSEFDSHVSAYVESIDAAIFTLEDAAAYLRDYEKNINFSPERINEVELRLSLISSLKKKYGNSIDDILIYSEQARREIQTISSSDDEIDRLNDEYRRSLREAKELALSLSNKRAQTARKLELLVIKELSDLGMGDTILRVTIKREINPDGEIESDNKRYVLYPHGLDRIEFMLSTNRGEELRQLKKVASGGEMSRIMLAIKNVILSDDIVETLIFDEVDAGIGGKIADTVGKKLKTLSHNRQVLVITHLPQIAAMSDSHFLVAKTKTADRTTTTVTSLTRKDKVMEVARMLAGENVTDISIRHAEELINAADRLHAKA